MMKDAIRISYNAKKGTVENLCKHISQEDFEGLCLMGLIKMGVERIEGKVVRTWAASAALKDEYDFFFGGISSDDKAIARKFYPEESAIS